MSRFGITRHLTILVAVGPGLRLYRRPAPTKTRARLDDRW